MARGQKAGWEVVGKMEASREGAWEVSHSGQAHVPWWQVLGLKSQGFHFMVCHLHKFQNLPEPQFSWAGEGVTGRSVEGAVSWAPTRKAPRTGVTHSMRLTTVHCMISSWS